MIRSFRVVVAGAVWMCAATSASGYQQDASGRAYLRAVAQYFEVPVEEVGILARWDLPVDEIPVALFVARRAGISAEALVALRESGRPWTALIATYNINASALHVPLRDPASAGALMPVYERFGEAPVQEWPAVELDEAEIIGLVNVRVLSQVVGVSPDEIARRTSQGTTFVELYAQLLR